MKKAGDRDVSDHPTIGDELLHAYLDSRLSPADRERVEKELERDEALRQRLEAYRHQHAGLKALFAAPNAESSRALLKLAHSEERSRDRRAVNDDASERPGKEA